MELLVSTQWLADHLGDPRLKIIDATYYALEPERDAAADFAKAHVPGALFLDLEHLKDAADSVPGQAPGQAQMAARLRALGIGEGDRIVIYDGAPHKTGCRAWWLTKLYGLSDVAMLDGGFGKWRAEGRAIETGAPSDPGGGGVPIERHSERVRTLDEMKTIVAKGGTQILDARSASRFTGAEPDPRAGVAPGHIPGSGNLPYGRLFEADGTWKRGKALAAEFEAAGIDLDRPVITTCGSGVTASILLFGLALLGRDHWALYDGSWSEWGALADTPKAVGL